MLQSVKKHNILSADYLTYCLADCSPQSDDTVSTYVALSKKKDKSQIKAYFLYPKDPISNMGFLAPIRLAYDSNKIRKGATMWILPRYVQETLANALKSCLCAENCLAFLAASVRNEQHRSCILLHTYPDVVTIFSGNTQTPSHCRKRRTSRAVHATGQHASSAISWRPPWGVKKSRRRLCQLHTKRCVLSKEYTNWYVTICRIIGQRTHRWA